MDKGKSQSGRSRSPPRNSAQGGGITPWVFVKSLIAQADVVLFIVPPDGWFNISLAVRDHPRGRPPPRWWRGFFRPGGTRGFFLVSQLTVQILGLLMRRGTDCAEQCSPRIRQRSRPRADRWESRKRVVSCASHPHPRKEVWDHTRGTRSDQENDVSFRLTLAHAVTSIISS